MKNLLPELQVPIKNPKATRWVYAGTIVTIVHYCGGSSVTVKHPKSKAFRRDDLVSSAELAGYIKSALGVL